MIPGVLAGLAVLLWLSPPARVPVSAGVLARRPARSLGVVGIAAGAGAVGVAAGAPRPTAVVLVLAGASWGLWRLGRRRALGRTAAANRERVLESCELLVAELGAGQPTGAALARAADGWSWWGPVAHTEVYGGDVPGALRRAAAAPGADGLALVAAAWEVSHRTGHGLVDALGRVATSLREAQATDRVVAGELASARATSRLVAALPLLAWAIGAGSGGDPVGFLVGTPAGLACLGGGLALGIGGLAWIERIAAEAGS